MATVNGVECAWGFGLSYGRGSGYGAGGYATLAECLAEVVRMVGYYAGLGYTVTVSDVHASCVTCGGSGKVPGKRKLVKCSACKGQGTIYDERSAVEVGLEVGTVRLEVSLRDLRTGNAFGNKEAA